jgi:negative regulator of flagellin synthesis FlgM
MSSEVAMKVNEPSPIRPSSARGLSERREEPERGSDRVSTLETARAAEVVATAARSAAGARALRLQAIETAVRQGTYTPDPQRIAARILDEAELAAKLQAMLRR